MAFKSEPFCVDQMVVSYEFVAQLIAVLPEITREMKRNVDEQMQLQMDWVTTLFDHAKAEVEASSDRQTAQAVLDKMDKFELSKTKNLSMYEKLKI